MTGLRHRILLHAYVTEKSMDEMERLNKLEFVVDRRANRAEVKRAIEELYSCKVAKVNMKIVRSGKIATVRFAKDYSAEDIGTRAGVF
ncbi:MAG: 50S ribosomal protein L23 [Candidatus Thermoplasmatota archaeon]|jgi:large subunit ribosomal protein L23|nr:50S ribosomal protein L23 [Candidatus Thermoplasmatota archaeon]MCL5983234.1 50S ribosomal protein L23 [Candidatus Thermoplasmatota archaeon]